VKHFPLTVPMRREVLDNWTPVDVREPQASGVLAAVIVVTLTAGMLCFAWLPASHGGDWQGPEMPPCAPDYLVVC